MPSLHIHPKVRQPLARPDVAVGRCWRAAKRPQTSKIQILHADRFHSVFGCFRIFLRGVRPWEVVFGCRGCKIRVPAATRADLLDITILGTRTDFDCISLRNRSRESVCMVAPHSEQTRTFKRTNFQYKVIHIPQGDSYKTVAPQDVLDLPTRANYSITI